MKARVLFLEDSVELQRAVAKALANDCELTMAATNADARRALESAAFELVLLDLSLPDGDGLKICCFIRQSEDLKHLPVLALTGKGEIEDKEMAFHVGVDDYLVKPISGRELRARVVASLRRARRSQEVFLCGDLKFYPSSQKLIVATSGLERQIELTALEFKLLLFLAKHREQVFSRDQLLSSVWGENVHLLERTVDAHISHLRRKLKTAGSGASLLPVPRVGYKLAG